MTMPPNDATTVPSDSAPSNQETPNKTDKDLMMEGRLYQAFSAELTKERISIKDLCFEFNHKTRPSDLARRMELTKQILGRSDAIIEAPFNCDYGYNIKLGKNFYANHGCTILDCNLVTIGDNVFLAPHVCISAASHPLSATLRCRGDELTEPIQIGNDVWIGANATILPGVTIGNGVVVGAGAVVTRDMPDNVVCAGVPAKIIRLIDQELMEREERQAFS